MIRKTNTMLNLSVRLLFVKYTLNFIISLIRNIKIVSNKLNTTFHSTACIKLAVNMLKFK